MLIHAPQGLGWIGRGLALQAVGENAASMTTPTHIAGTGIAVVGDGQSMAEFINPAMQTILPQLFSGPSGLLFFGGLMREGNAALTRRQN